MNKTYITLCLCLFCFSACAEETMTREGNTYIVNTTTTDLCSAKGFKSTTPLRVYIENDRVVRIEDLPNNESKGYYERVRQQLFPHYKDKKVTKALKISKTDVESIDGVSGATFSAKATQANITAALEYFVKHKKK